MPFAEPKKADVAELGLADPRAPGGRGAVSKFTLGA